MPLPLIIDTDSYKTSHWKQYPPNTTEVSSYIEARQSFFRGMSLLEPAGYDGSVFFGLNYFLKNFLSQRTTHTMVDRMRDICAKHGVPFNEQGWRDLVNRHGGVMPLEVSALPEGMVTPAGIPQVQVRNTDPEFGWLVSYIETRLLSCVWYGSTVATLSREIKRVIRMFMEQAGEPLDGIDFMLHDFGSRGVSSQESAGIGGMAHLVNFKGTDTLAAIYAASEFYGCDMAGFSIPAAEHSTMTAWTKDGEVEAYRNMLKQYGKPGAIIAVVSDSYDIYNAVENIWGGVLKEEVEAFGKAGGKLVIRPDSGLPEKVVPQLLKLLLGEKFGYTRNERGFKKLPPYIGVIQGDGINYESIKRIMYALTADKWSPANLAFGMGGALLQQVNRDTLGYAMKACEMVINQQRTDIYKQPATDSAKRSKRGRQAVVQNDIGIFAKREDELVDGEVNLLQPVWINGELIRDISFEEVRANAALK